MNNPLSSIDRQGLAVYPIDRWFLSMDQADNFYGVGGTGCTMDGADASCGMVMSALGAGSAVQCPNNDCGIGTATPFQCVGSVCGYMSNQYVATHENEYNGVLYSKSEWQTFLLDRVDAQRQALTDAIVAANPGLDWGDVYGDLQYLYTKGGNANFSYEGDVSDLGFVPGYDTGGCELTCRYGGIPSIHMPGSDAEGDPILHLDSGDPLWGFGLGAIVHGFVDVLLGNINPAVPMNPW